MEDETTNAYELQRQQIIARNRARLLALGIPEAVRGLNKLVPVKRPRAPRPKREPQEPSRQSGRLRDKEMIARGEVPPEVEPGSDLALFIIDGECPRCGKVLSVGHARHLETCKGPPEPPTEEEIAAKAEAYKSQQKDKLQQLELGGLVDYQPGTHDAADANTATDTTAAAAAAGSEGAAEPQGQQKGSKGRAGKKGGKAKGKGKKKAAAAAAAAAEPEPEGAASATFIVIGSKGDHYAIKLTDAKRTCQCLDHRFRRHDCKHIRLILEQLGVSEDPTAWQQALEQQLSELGTADEDDVQRVMAAEQRAQERKAKAAAKAAAAAAATAAAAEGDEGADAAAEGAEGHEDAAAAGAAAADAAMAGGEEQGASGQQRGRAAGRKRKAAA